MELVSPKIDAREAFIQIIKISSARNVISVVQIVPDLHQIIVLVVNLILS